MFSRRLVVLLMLIMAVMPVSVTYAHYSGNELFSTVHAISSDDLATDKNISNVGQDHHCHPSKYHCACFVFHIPFIAARN